MKTIFVDTAYLVAILSGRDDFHIQATRHFETSRDRMVTTSLICVELANRLARTPGRTLVHPFFRDLESDARFEILWVDEALLSEAESLYDERSDKTWSLVDCVSFIIMRKRAIAEALTTDHHFEQAGFAVLLSRTDE